VPAESIARALRETGGTHTSLFDALFAAIMESDAQSGPKMAAVLTDGATKRVGDTPLAVPGKASLALPVSGRKTDTD
jgi:hypothetical protein